MKKIFALAICLATMLSTFAETLKNEAFFYDSEMEASLMRSYTMTIPNNLSSAAKHKLYELAMVNPNNLTTSEMADDMSPMSSSMIPRYRAIYNNGDRDMSNWDETTTVKIMTNTSSLLVLEVENTFYMGGAHGGCSMEYLNWDPADNREIKLGDYVKTPAQRTALKNHLYTLARKKLGSVFTMSKSEFQITETFYVTATGLTFVYGEYEIGPYSAGIVKLSVPFTTLNNLGKGNTTTTKKTGTRKTGTKRR